MNAKELFLYVALFIKYPTLKCEVTLEVMGLNETELKDTHSTKPNQIIITDSDAETRKPLKLFPKQKVILNQVLQVYSLTDVKNNTLCQKHSEEFKIGLRAFEPWALKMFDSSSKLQSGILNGNLVEFGSFKQCIEVYYESQHGPIRGQQCVIKVKPTANIVKKILGFRNVSNARYEKIKELVEGTTILWSVCVPDSCTYNDVLEHFKTNILSITQGLDLNINLKEHDCYAMKDVKPFTNSEWIVIFILLFIILLMVVSTISDLYTRNADGSNDNKALQIFSAYANTEYLLSDKLENHTELDCLNGFRAISILYVVCGHRFTMPLFFPAINSLETIEWLNRFTSTIITGGTLSVDTFFMISGLLASYHTCSYLSKGRKFKLWQYYLHRYIRLTPSVAIVTLILATISHRFGSGPLWKLTSKVIQMPCKYYWWSALLHLQSYINPKYICMIQTWYLTCDMQYYLFSPLLIYPLFKWPNIGYAACVLAYLSTASTSFYIAWIKEFRANGLTTNRLATAAYFTQHYILPYTRAPTYVMGLTFGYVLFRVKGMKIKMSRPILILGWIISTTIIFLVYWGFYVFQLEHHPYNRMEQSIFLSFARSGWTASMLWMIWICVHGYGGIVNTFLSCYLFRVLARLSYSIFLIHLPGQFLSCGALKMPLYFSDYTNTVKFFGDVVTYVFVAYFLTICVECPAVKAETLLMRRGKRKIDNARLFVQVKI